MWLPVLPDTTGVASLPDMTPAPPASVKFAIRQYLYAIRQYLTHCTRTFVLAFLYQYPCTSNFVLVFLCQYFVLLLFYKNLLPSASRFVLPFLRPLRSLSPMA